MILTAGAAGASPNYSGHNDHNNAVTCASGNVASGRYSSLTIKGHCTIPDGAVVTVSKHLFLNPGSSLNAMTASTVHVKGSVLVARDAYFALGCSLELTQPPFPGGPVFCPAGVSHDQVDGNVIATQPRTLKINGVTLNGNLVSVGGGAAVTGPSSSTCEQQPAPLNFPIKDNTINGNVLVSGWQGCWLGYIRNVTSGNAVFIGNRTADADSSEIFTNTISRNLICLANSPAPQVGDSHGELNTVRGRSIGQCAGL